MSPSGVVKRHKAVFTVIVQNHSTFSLIRKIFYEMRRKSIETIIEKANVHTYI